MTEGLPLSQQPAFIPIPDGIPDTQTVARCIAYLDLSSVVRALVEINGAPAEEPAA